MSVDISEVKEEPVFVAEPVPVSVSVPVAPLIKEKPASTRAKSTLNLQNILLDKSPAVDTKSKPEKEEKQNSKPLKLADVQVAWKQFAESRKTQVAEYGLLQRDWELVGNTIQLQLTNPVEEPLLVGIKTDLLTFLKEKLNSSLNVEGVIIKSASKKIIYTNKEKFDHLAEKNPILHELKDRLGLDTDY